MPNRSRWQHPDPQARDLITLAQLADLAGESVAQTEILIQQGKLPAHVWRKAFIDGRERWTRRWRRGEAERAIAQWRWHLSGASERN